MTLGVSSEVARLREVILHRPGHELRRLTPTNRADLLFDDLPWVERAQDEHDVFADLLRADGVRVRLLGELLTEALAAPSAREEVVATVGNPRRVGPALADRLSEYLEGLRPQVLAEHLLAGLTVEECAVPASLVARTAGPQGFLLPPLPNAVFTRDPTAWIGARVVLAPLSRAARGGERLVWRTLYRHHPDLAGSKRWLDDEPDLRPEHTLEGGDVLVLSPSTAAVGVSERSTPQAVERLALALLAGDGVEQVLAVLLPAARGTMHLDTVLSVVDVDAVVLWPRAPEVLRAFWVRPGDRSHPLRVEPAGDLVAALAEGLGVDRLRVVAASEDPVLADREQWDDGTNTLALRPGVVVAYERNAGTNERLAAAGIEVRTIGSSELPRGRGGPRCMSNPIRRG